MNKVIKTVIIVSVLAMLPLLGWAEGPKSKGSDKMGMKGMMGMCPEHMMMNKMMDHALVATNDGGVIILAGNKLIKFDKDLNMVKKAEVDLDIPGMQKMMMDMRDKCPMCKKMMSECQMK
jgi:hypothetical protein